MDIGLSLATGVIIGLLVHIYGYVTYVPNKLSETLSYVLPKKSEPAEG